MRHEWGSRLAFGTCAAIVIAALVLVYVFVGSQAYETFTQSHVSPGQFFGSTIWDGAQRLGILVYIVGSLALVMLGLVIAVPLSIGTALYITEIAPPWLGAFLRSTVELLLGIPSVIFGLLGLLIVVPFIRFMLNSLAGGIFFNGFGLIAAAVVVCFMIVPTITTIAVDALRAVPGDLREGSLALGATPWQMMTGTLVPAASPGILTGVILGAARILGETVAIAFVIGGAVHLPITFNPNVYPYIYIGPTSVLTIPLLDFKEALPPSTIYNALWTVAFVLLVISGLFVFASRAVAARRVY